MSAPARSPRRVARAPERHPAPRPRPGARPRLRVVDPAVRRRARLVRRAVRGAVLLGAVSVFAIVAFHVVLAQGQLRLDRLSSRTAAEQARYEKLRLEVARSAAPERIVTRAVALGLVPAGQATFVSAPGSPGGRVATGGSADDPTSPTLARGWSQVKAHLAAQP